MRGIRILFFSFLLFTSPLQAQSELDTQIKKGRDAIYNLDFDRAEEIFQALIRANPDEPTAHAFLSITYWNKLLQAAGSTVLDDYATPTPFTKRQSHKSVAKETLQFREATERLIELCDRLLKQDQNSVLALYMKGVGYENLAAEAVAITKSSGKAMANGRKAEILHKKVLKLDPEFVDAKLSIGTSEFAKATLPWSIRWLAFLLGFRGNKEHALALLYEVGEKGRYRRLDALVVIALLQAWKGDAGESIRIFQALGEQYPRNYLFDLQRAAIYDKQLNQLKAALEVYQKLIASLDQKAPSLAPAEVYYRLGVVYYKLKDYSLALDSFEKALNLPNKESETRALSSLQIARIHTEQGDSKLAREYYAKVLEYQGPAGVLKSEINEAKERLKR
jgi:tetratricopeptide (TPR) repeat protein